MPVRRVPDAGETRDGLLQVAPPWAYADHGARWLFSNHELEKQRETADGLAKFILTGDGEGRTRTEISRGYFKGNKTAAEISTELAPLIHDGVVIEVKDGCQ